MTMNRREFLKAASAAGCLGAVSRLAWGASGDRPLLVTLFLRGAADGLHLVGPSADPDYVAARPPELRVTDGGDHPGAVLERSLDPAAGFRLHPAAAPLAELYQGGRLAVVHAVGLADGTRSHFVAQDLVERGVADEKQGAVVATGWLGRVLADRPGLVSGYSAGAAEDFALRGATAVLAAQDVSSGLGVPWGPPTAALLRSLNGGGDTVSRATAAALDLLDGVDRRLPRDAGGKIAPYQPAGKASYEGAGELSRALASVARLARMDVGLAAACVDHGGWDTHEGQAGRFANQARQLALGLTAFHEDMAAAGRRAVVVAVTEFGRRLRANKSGGTDHGHGACWLVLGDGVQGGRMYGRWPGLATPVLDQGVDLAVTTDYRRVLTEALTACGLAAGRGFPQGGNGPALGLFGAV